MLLHFGAGYIVNDFRDTAPITNFDMVAVLAALLAEDRTRALDARIIFRPDHGHRMLDDLNKRTNPGYSAIGRLKGLAELRGAIKVLEYGKPA